MCGAGGSTDGRSRSCEAYEQALFLGRRGVDYRKFRRDLRSITPAHVLDAGPFLDRGA